MKPVRDAAIAAINDLKLIDDSGIDQIRVKTGGSIEAEKQKVDEKADAKQLKSRKPRFIENNDERRVHSPGKLIQHQDSTVSEDTDGKKVTTATQKRRDAKNKKEVTQE